MEGGADKALLAMRESGDRLLAVLADAYALQRRKAGDYNAGVDRDLYFPMGIPSYAQMLWVKSLRLISFAKLPREAAHESARDTALDLINYAAFLAEWLDREEQRVCLETTKR